MDRLIFDYPTLDEVKKKLDGILPNMIEITLKSKFDNIEEFVIFDYLVNTAGYSFEKLTPTNSTHTTFIAQFKRKN